MLEYNDNDNYRFLLPLLFDCVRENFCSDLIFSLQQVVGVAIFGVFVLCLLFCLLFLMHFDTESIKEYYKLINKIKKKKKKNNNNSYRKRKVFHLKLMYLKTAICNLCLISLVIKPHQLRPDPASSNEQN